MKIGFFTDYYLPAINGVSISIELFRKALEEQGHTVYIFCPKYPKTPKDEPSTIVRFNSIPGMWYEDYRDTFPWTPKNIRYIKSLDLDIIHIHTGAQIGVLGMRISKEENTPLVQTYHTDVVRYSTIYRGIPIGASMLLFVGKMNIRNSISYREIFRVFKPDEEKKIRWSQKIVKDTIKILCNISDLVIVPSRKVEEMIRSYGTTSPSVIIPTGLDIEELNKLNHIPKELANRLVRSGPVLLAVGRLGQEKNFQLVIKTLPRLINKYPNIKLVLVGGGPYEHNLKELVRDSDLDDYVIFTGWLDHSSVLDIYNHADIFVFPSQTDTQGLVLNEAAYFGLPIVFGDHLISDVAKDNVNGYHAKTNATSMASKIDLILSNPKLKTKFSNASKRLAKNLDIKIQAKRLESAYRQLLKKHG